MPMEISSSPLLTVIIPTRNRVKYLKRSLDSLFECIDAEFQSTEVIVIDGGSTDGTIDLLNSYGDGITLWISEPDRSVAEAINKGIKRAKGQIIRLLGDDDAVLPGGLVKLVAYLDEHPEIDAVIGQNVVLIEDDNGNTTSYRQKKFVGDVKLGDLWTFPYCGFLIPECMFARRKVYECCKGYDLEFRYWGYLDLFFRIIESGLKIRVVPELILTTYQTSVSDSIRWNDSPRWNKEWQLVQRRHVPLYWRLWHKFGGEVSVTSVIKYGVRTACKKIFGLSPRQLLRIKR